LTGIKPLNIFYEEPDPDRWVKFDRYPRRWIRRMIRGKQRPGGVMMVALGLMRGLDKINIPYRFNNYAYIKKHPEEIACIIGKPHLIFERKWRNPILFGAGVYSHPIDCPNLFEQYPQVKRILVPGEWIRKMFEPFYGGKVAAWPVGIDTNYWNHSAGIKTVDFLIYDKLNRDRDNQVSEVLDPIIEIINQRGLTFQVIRYGAYKPDWLKQALNRTKAAIFLSESETQGLGYQQILATNTPILAWDRGGYWQDPYYYPDKVKYQPVSSVPYWDDRCGIKFKNAAEFKEKLCLFINRLAEFEPRKFVLENLTLAISAEKYMQIYHEVEKEIV
jgi:hypothetical protein